MNILGVGPLELLLVFLLLIVLFGPKDIQKASKSLGRWLNQAIHSDIWQSIQQVSQRIRNLPSDLMREANLEEFKETTKIIDPSINQTGYLLDDDPSTDQNHIDLSGEGDALTPLDDEVGD